MITALLEGSSQRPAKTAAAAPKKNASWGPRSTIHVSLRPSTVRNQSKPNGSASQTRMEARFGNSGGNVSPRTWGEHDGRKHKELSPRVPPGAPDEVGDTPLGKVACHAVQRQEQEEQSRWIVLELRRSRPEH